MPSPLASAIANAEGFNVPGSLPARNNNPGDLRGWPGVPTDTNGYSVFPSSAVGWAALEQQLSMIATGQSAYYSPDMTIAQMGAIWANGDASWAANVAAYLGVTTGAMIGQFTGGVAQAMPVTPTGTTDAATSSTSAITNISPQGVPAFLILAAGAMALFLLASEVF